MLNYVDIKVKRELLFMEKMWYHVKKLSYKNDMNYLNDNHQEDTL